MDWIFELLFEMLGALWPFGHRREDRSVVGKSRLDEETARFWWWIALAALVIGAALWLLTRA